MATRTPLGPLPDRSCVLIVDDEPLNVRLLEVALKDVEGLRVVTTTSALEAASLFQEVGPDLVLLDLHMPGMDGVAVMGQLHDLIPAEDFVPIMVLTADVTRESREAALRAGAHDFLLKPLDPTEVVLRVSNLLRTRALHLAVQRNRADLAERLRRHEDRLREEQQRLAQIAERIWDVLDREAVEMVFQPIVDLASHEAVGYEALARFEGEPVRGPDQWFAEANERGLGRELEFLAVARALALLDQIPAQKFLTLNLSPKWVASGDFAEFLEGRDGSRLVVEFTEHTRIEDYPALVAQMEILRERGFRFAVDDAGAGFASLQHILRLRPDWIKLDIELTRGVDADPARRALAASLVFFADEVGAHVISEGVETAAEESALADIGVRFAQGYHLGRPGPLPE